MQLEAGTNVLLAGCERDLLVDLARQFPRSRFFGLEPVAGRLAAARRAVHGAGIRNAWVEPALSHLPYLRDIFSLAIRSGGDATALLPSLLPVLREDGLFMDVGDEPLSPENYHEAALVVLRSLALPDAHCVLARKWLPAEARPRA